MREIPSSRGDNNDERDETLGQKIIETRLLIKDSKGWSVADYLWNEEEY